MRTSTYDRTTANQKRHPLFNLHVKRQRWQWNQRIDGGKQSPRSDDPSYLSLGDFVGLVKGLNFK